VSDADATEGVDERRPHPLRNWQAPLLTAVSMAVAVGLVAVVDPVPGPLVLAAVLAMTLSRNRLVTSWRGRAEAIILLPVVGLATAGVGYLFIHLAIVGAVAYVTAMFLSIWLRRFGTVGSRVGSLIALPFITLLIAPGAGVGTTPLGVALLSVVVLAVVVALRLFAELIGYLPRPVRRFSPEAGNPPSRPITTPHPPSMMRPVASTRMAIQMAIALTAAFVIGFLVFPQHVTWVVLTAFIVCSGNRGRADVLYKSGLRIAGAGVGTIVASASLAIDPVIAPHGESLLQGPALVIVLLVIISIGLWLREWTYAAWAVVMTLVITLLQGAVVPAGHLVGTDPEGGQLWVRILAIIVGAACGIAASWFVLPVKSESVVRRRIADALAALSEFATTPDPLTDRDLSAALDKLDEVAKPWAAWERISARRRMIRRPGQWMRLVHESARLVRARPDLTADQRRALGAARKSMREPDAIGPALQEFREELSRR